MRNLIFSLLNICCYLTWLCLIIASAVLAITNPVLGLSLNGKIICLAVLAIPAIFLAMYLGDTPAR